MRVCLSHPTGPLGTGCAAVCPLFMINFPVVPSPHSIQAPSAFGFPPLGQRPRLAAAWHFVLGDCRLGGGAGVGWNRPLRSCELLAVQIGRPLFCSPP